MLLAVPSGVLVGCGDDEEPRTQSVYCTEAAASTGLLDQTTFADIPAITAAVEQFATMHRLAPLAVEPEWGVLEQVVRAAADLDPSDTSAVARLAVQARLARTAADRVVIYTQRICGVLLGDVAVTEVPLVPAGTAPEGTATPSTTAS